MVTENTISENGGGNADDKGAEEFGASKRDSLRNSGQRTKKPEALHKVQHEPS